jgi:hypothetical protein
MIWNLDDSEALDGSGERAPHPASIFPPVNEHYPKRSAAFGLVFWEPPEVHPRNRQS